MSIPPADLPEWASNDVQDPVSGQFNVVEPPTEVKQEGWRYLEKPNRQWWNWFNRTVYDWIVYLSGAFGSSAANLYSTQMTPVWSGLTNQPSPNIFFYSVVGDKVFYSGRMTFTGNLDTTNTINITNLPFPVKNLSGFLQVGTLVRGNIVTLANGQNLFMSAVNNDTKIRIRQTDMSTGITSDIINPGTDGEFAFSGFYIREI